MSAISKVLREAGSNGYRMLMFRCPGCKEAHGVSVSRPEGQAGPVWGYNGNPDKPTFTPSILVTGYRVSPEGEAMMDRGDPPPEGGRYPGSAFVCHSFVTDGRIQFLGDCTHALAWQTVDLPEIES